MIGKIKGKDYVSGEDNNNDNDNSNKRLKTKTRNNPPSHFLTRVRRVERVRISSSFSNNIIIITLKKVTEEIVACDKQT